MSAEPVDIHPVILAGAGPGDPGLITVAAAEALKRAEVVLHDRLVSPALLQLAEGAELIDVGKTPGRESISQDRINSLLIEHALRGRRVVRLKGGDPFVFGRGGEEATALATAGIPMQIVPGVSSAIAAASAFGIAVTDRRAASAVTIVTGSEGDGEAPPIVWDRVAGMGGTIVVMMGWRNIKQVVARLVGSGLSANTPAAAVERAWSHDQRAVFATLGRIEQEAAGMSPPVTLVIGKTISLATPEASGTIAKRRILVTRAKAQAGVFVQRLRALNAEVIELPTIEIVAAHPALIDAAVDRLANREYDMVVLTSVNGVDHLWRGLRRGGLDSRALTRVKVAVVGGETAKALEARGIHVDIVPDIFTTAELATLLLDERIIGMRILLARATQGSLVLSELLRDAGAEVEDLALYDVITPEPDREALEELQHGVDVVTLTSPSTAEGLAKLAGEHVDLHSLQTVCIGPVTAEAARRLGFNVVRTAEVHTIEGLAQAVGHEISRMTPTETPTQEPG